MGSYLIILGYSGEVEFLEEEESDGKLKPSYPSQKYVAVPYLINLAKDNDNSYHYYARKGAIYVWIIDKLKQFLYRFKLACITDYSGLKVL